jgi:carbon monoxide dehydrogenase subunit G
MRLRVRRVAAGRDHAADRAYSTQRTLLQEVQTMARYDRSIHIDAPPPVVWDVIADVAKWPDWTPTILTVVRQEDGAFGLGSTAKVHPRGFPDALLTVTEFTPGRSFTWEGTGGIGMTVQLAHVVEPDGGGSRATLSVIPGGFAAPFFGWLAARMSKKNVDIEAESLKARAESIAAAGRA